MPRPGNCFIEICEAIALILLMLKVHFTYDSEVGGLFCFAPSGFETRLFFGDYFNKSR